MSIARKMASRITDFLVIAGNYPAYKKTNPIQEQLSERLARRLRGMFSDVNKKIIAGLIARGSLPPEGEELNRFLTAYYTEVFGEKVANTIAESSLDSSIDGYAQMARDLTRMNVEVLSDRLPDYAREKLFERHLEFSQATFERITGDVKDKLITSMDEGLGINEAAEQLSSEFDSLEDYKLRRIARTEIQSAQNEGAYQSMDDNNVEYVQWITADDDRVRGQGAYDEADHIFLHGCVVRRGEVFPNGLEYPGDRSGDISEWINCRCALVPYIPSRGEVITNTPYWP